MTSKQAPTKRVELKFKKGNIPSGIIVLVQVTKTNKKSFLCQIV